MSIPAAWLNVNGSYGLNVAETPDYPGLADLLHEMDRLGVAQAVAWNKSAVPHAPGGNRRLLDALAACPGARDRIIPAFAVAPAMCYERGAMDELVRAVRDGGIRVLRALPKTLFYDLRNLDSVLEPLVPYKPAVLLSVNEWDGPAALLELAAHFPALTFILTDAMWQHLDAVFACLRRRPNIWTDTSWIHVQGALDLLVRTFGPERVVFGMGPRSHAGAAMAGLARSGLDPAALAAVAYGTMARRLGLKDPPPAGGPAGKGPDAYWTRLLRGERIGPPLLDAHAHLGASSRWILEESDIARTVRQLLERMDRLGVEQTIVFPGSNPLADDVVAGNAALESVTHPHHDRLKGMVSFHPAYAGALAARLDDWFARDFFVGFKILCSYWNVPIEDSVFIPAWDYASRHRLPILIHTWGGSYDSPGRVAAVAQRYPEAMFLLGHSGGNDAGRAEAEAAARELDNVYLEWCGSFCSARRWEDTIRAVGPRKIVFGTDSVYHNIDWELGRLLSLDVEDETLNPILGETMRGILRRRR